MKCSFSGKYIYFVISLLMLLILYGCGDKRITESEIKSELNIVDGKTNEIRIGGILFSIPGDYRIETVEADENKIRKKSYDDAVSRIILHLNLSSWFDHPPITPGEGNALIRIEIKSSGHEDGRRIENKLNESSWQIQNDIPEWNLIEHVSKEFPQISGWGALAYSGLGVKTPMGSLIVYSCTADYTASKKSIAKPTVCLTTYQLIEGPMITYSISGVLLPRWKEVHTKVVDTINTFIVKS